MKKELDLNNITYIQKGTHIVGNIESAGKVHISGRLKGNINSKDHVVLNPEAIVHGNIVTKRAEISGELNGDIYITDLLVLKRSARINGNIYSKFLVTEEGSQVNGLIQTGKDVNILKENPLEENQSAIPQRKAG